MTVGLNLLYLIPGVVGGVQTYAEGLLQGLQDLPEQTDYVVFVSRDAAGLPLPRGRRFRRVVVPVSARSRVLRYAVEQCWLPWLARRHGVDVLHSLGYVGPVWAPCPTVVTVHDLNFARLAAQMPLHRRIALRFFSAASAARAARVITVSRFSRGELCGELALDPARVEVVYHGLSEGGCRAGASPGDLPALPSRYAAAFTGGGMQHKNIDRLLPAFEAACCDLPHELVLIGRVPASLSSTGKVRALGYLSADAVQRVIAGADAFVLPSVFEGFGFPVLEAQRAGVPVACSDAASLPEVGGDGALYFPPESIEEMAGTIRRVLTDASLRGTLVARGRRNVERFSWKEAASRTHDIYRLAAALDAPRNVPVEICR